MSNILTALFFATALLFSGVLSAEDLKIGYVQVDKILKKAPQTSATGKLLEREFSPRSAELEKMKKKITDMESAIENERLKLTDARRRKKLREVTNLRIEFKRKQLELREDINIRKNEELSVLQDRINKAVKTVSETGGYDLVMYGGVAYANKKIDITDKVLKLLAEK